MEQDRGAREPGAAAVPAAQEKAKAVKVPTKERAGEPVDAGPRLVEKVKQTRILQHSNVKLRIFPLAGDKICLKYKGRNSISEGGILCRDLTNQGRKAMAL